MWGSLTNCTATENDGDGIVAAGDATVRDCHSYLNGLGPLEDAGVTVVRSPAEIGAGMQRALAG